MFLRDQKRLQSAYALANTNPLGACALAGTTFPIDRHLTTELLGFDAPHEHALDVISSRDFIAEVLFALSLVMANLSRISEEIIYWTTYEFGMAVLDDAYSFGSSIMPQKKNPDVAELARAKAGRLIGHLTGLLATLKGLPLAYAKDLQEDKEPLFDAVDTTLLTLAALDGVLATARFNTGRMADAASSPYAAATDLAEWLVARGAPFREAHAAVGDLVRRSLSGEGSLAGLAAADDRLGPEAAALLEPGASAARRNTRGAGGPRAVAAQLERFRERIETDAARFG